jgi:hypothetical protein
VRGGGRAGRGRPRMITPTEEGGRREVGGPHKGLPSAIGAVRAAADATRVRPLRHSGR